MAEQTQLNIYQKLAKVRKQVEVMKKDTKGYGYNYTKEEDILAKITGQMEKLGLMLTPMIIPDSLVVSPYNYKKNKIMKDGKPYEDTVNEVIVQCDMMWMWVNIDDPKYRLEVPWGMVGMQSDASQSFGSGLTYASRYFLLKFFNIATSDDDPDKFRTKQKEAEAEADRLVAEEIAQKIDEFLKEYLEEHEDKREDALKVVQKYIKSGNYHKITESALIGKLLTELAETFK